MTGGAKPVTSVSRDLPLEVWQQIFAQAKLPKHILARCMRVNRSIHEAITPLLYHKITITPDQLRSPLYDGFAAAMKMSGAAATGSSSSRSSGKGSQASSQSSRPARARSSALAKRRKIDNPPSKLSPTSSAAPASAGSKAYTKVEGYDASRTRKALALRCVKVVNIMGAFDVDRVYHGLDLAPLAGADILRLDFTNTSHWGMPLEAPKALDYLEKLRPKTLVLYSRASNGWPDIPQLAPQPLLLEVSRISLVCTNQSDVLISLSEMTYRPRPVSRILESVLSALRISPSRASFSPSSSDPNTTATLRGAPEQPTDTPICRLPVVPAIDIVYPSPVAVSNSHYRGLREIYYARETIKSLESAGAHFTYVNTQGDPVSWDAMRLGLAEGPETFLDRDLLNVRKTAMNAVIGMQEYIKGVGGSILREAEIRHWR